MTDLGEPVLIQHGNDLEVALRYIAGRAWVIPGIGDALDMIHSQNKRLSRYEVVVFSSNGRLTVNRRGLP
jgi:hypothetical protein